MKHKNLSARAQGTHSLMQFIFIIIIIIIIIIIVIIIIVIIIIIIIIIRLQHQPDAAAAEPRHGCHPCRRFITAVINSSNFYPHTLVQDALCIP